MTPQKLGPGHLKFGETGSEKEFGSMTLKTELSAELETEDPTPMLDGTEYAGAGKTTGAISGTFYQDYSVDGLVAWTWKHRGETLPFEFKPLDNAALSWRGKCQIAPVTVGGDALKENTADFEFKFVGEPEMVANGATNTPPANPAPGK